MHVHINTSDSSSVIIDKVEFHENVINLGNLFYRVRYDVIFDKLDRIIRIYIAGINTIKHRETRKIGNNFIEQFNDCNGKDNTTYTLIGAQESDAQCSQDSIVTIARGMIAYKPNGEKAIINLFHISTIRLPAGGDL